MVDGDVIYWNGGNLRKEDGGGKEGNGEFYFKYVKFEIFIEYLSTIRFGDINLSINVLKYYLKIWD